MVCTGWAPQLKILGHESVGGFLTHSSWTSVVEEIQNEKPLVLLMFFGRSSIERESVGGGEHGILDTGG